MSAVPKVGVSVRLSKDLLALLAAEQGVRERTEVIEELLLVALSCPAKDRERMANVTRIRMLQTPKRRR